MLSNCSILPCSEAYKEDIFNKFSDNNGYIDLLSINLIEPLNQPEMSGKLREAVKNIFVSWPGN